VGVVGLGDIGSNVAKRAAALGLNIVGWDPAAGLVPEYIRHKTWPEGIGECDFIVFACALNKVTKHIFNMQLLSLLKPGVRIINVSRGGLIDEKALLIGLEEGKVASAALDVFESEPLALSHPLREHQQLIFGSHNSSNTSDAVIRTSEKALQMMKDFLNG
jgi:D-3-phosphoglycerate dehydrogenase